jgi:hypothetical protein
MAVMMITAISLSQCSAMMTGSGNEASFDS